MMLSGRMMRVSTKEPDGSKKIKEIISLTFQKAKKYAFIQKDQHRKYKIELGVKQNPFK